MLFFFPVIVIPAIVGPGAFQCIWIMNNYNYGPNKRDLGMYSKQVLTSMRLNNK